MILGEVHDNPQHHQEQARLVQMIEPRAVVWEMLTKNQADLVSSTNLTDQAIFERDLNWQESGWPDFSMYHPIFLASGSAQHFGAAVPRSELRDVMEKGALAAWDDDAEGFDAALAFLPFDPVTQASLEREQAAAHCDALPETLLPAMVEAQRYRDATMAFVALQALGAGHRPVVIITGTGHARTDVGIPAIIRRLRPDISVWSLGQFEADPGKDAPYDAVRLAEPAERTDPCAAFR